MDNKQEPVASDNKTDSKETGQPDALASSSSCEHAAGENSKGEMLVRFCKSVNGNANIFKGIIGVGFIVAGWGESIQNMPVTTIGATILVGAVALLALVVPVVAWDKCRKFDFSMKNIGNIALGALKRSILILAICIGGAALFAIIFRLW